MTRVSAFKAWQLFVLNLCLAFILTLLPVTGIMEWFRPLWIPLLLTFWLLAQPNYFGLLTGWFVGLLVDAMQGNLLGIHAFSYSLLAYLVLKFQQRIHLFSLGQQAILIMMCLALSQFVIIFAYLLLGYKGLWLQALASVLLSGLLWPICYYALNHLNRRLGLL